MKTEVENFEYDNCLGDGIIVTLIVKGNDQRDIVRRTMLKRWGHCNFGISEDLSILDGVPFMSGFLPVKVSRVGFDDLHLEDACSHGLRYPYDFANFSGMELICGDDEVRSVSSGRVVRYSDSLMRRAHSLDPFGDELLVSSAGLDAIHLLDKSLNCVRVRRFNSELKQFQDAEINEGVATAGNSVDTSPFYLNGVRAGFDGEMLFSGYNSKSLFLEREGNCVEFDLDLCKPHSFQVFRGGYLVANSGSGELIFFDRRMRVREVLVFRGLKCCLQKQVAFGEWLQSVSIFGDWLLFIVDGLRNGIHVIDTMGRTRRFIEHSNTWRVHGCKPLERSDSHAEV